MINFCVYPIKYYSHIKEEKEQAWRPVQISPSGRHYSFTARQWNFKGIVYFFSSKFIYRLVTKYALHAKFEKST